MSEIAINEEQAQALGLNVEDLERFVEQAKETSRKIDEGLAAQVAEAPFRKRRLSALATGRVTPWMKPARSGDWSIEQWTVTPEQESFERMRATISSSSRGRWVPAGLYTMLRCGGTTVMSDTPDELFDLYDFVREARGRVLIHGLGLGCSLRFALSKPEVEHVDVVELSEDVIALVGPYFDEERVEIHQGDAYTYRFPRGTRWDVAWHDVWNDITIENDFATLHRRYGGRVEWQGSWGRERAIEADRRWRRENSWWSE